jgi:hypothetical protein
VPSKAWQAASPPRRGTPRAGVEQMAQNAENGWLLIEALRRTRSASFIGSLFASLPISTRNYRAFDRLSHDTWGYRVAGECLAHGLRADRISSASQPRPKRVGDTHLLSRQV